jgi:crotonobetainyl-CoA:carnitine CoA-transferase CaiB-like acyl-CoA transferase
MTDKKRRPLDGIRVIEVGQLLAGNMLDENDCHWQK